MRWQPAASLRRHAEQQCDCGPRRRGCHGPRRKGGAELSGGGGGLRSGLAATQLRSSSADEVDARRKRARDCKESPSRPLMYIQSDTSLLLHITTARTHGRCSCDMWYHERASVHFTVARSLRLKSGVSHDLCQSSPALAPGEINSKNSNNPMLTENYLESMENQSSLSGIFSQDSQLCRFSKRFTKKWIKSRSPTMRHMSRTRRVALNCVEILVFGTSWWS